MAPGAAHNNKAEPVPSAFTAPADANLMDHGPVDAVEDKGARRRWVEIHGAPGRAPGRALGRAPGRAPGRGSGECSGEQGSGESSGQRAAPDQSIAIISVP